MSGFTYRIPPCPYWDTKTMQAWLEEMAAKGFILGQEGIFPGIVAFEKALPQKIRYRLIASEHPYRKARPYRYAPIPDKETQAFHAEFGWQYIATRRDFHIYACTDLSAPEMETDSQVQALAYEQAIRREKVDVIGYSFIVAAYFLLLLWQVYEFLIGSNHRLALYHSWIGLMWLFYLVPALQGYWKLRQQQKLLEEGAPLHDSPGYRKTAPGYWLSLAGKALLIAALFLTVFHTPSAVYPQQDWISLSDYRGEIPFATMQELLPDAQLREDIAWGNEILTTSTVLADTWQLNQQLHITLPDGTKTSGSLNVVRRHTKLPSVARKQAEKAFSHGEKRNQEPILLAIDGIDYAFYYRDRTYDYVVLQKDNMILTVDLKIYNGDPLTPEDIAQIMAPYLNP